MATSKGKNKKFNVRTSETFSGDGNDAYGLTRHSGKHGTICARPFARTPEHAEKYAVMVHCGLHELDRIAPDSSGRLLDYPPAPHCHQLLELLCV